MTDTIEAQLLAMGEERNRWQRRTRESNAACGRFRTVIYQIGLMSMSAQADPYASAEVYRKALIDICNFALKAQEKQPPSTNAVDPHAQPSGTPTPRASASSSCAQCAELAQQIVEARKFLESMTNFGVMYEDSDLLRGCDQFAEVLGERERAEKGT